ncbi:YceI family protein [Salegentibacter salarius]|uniref:Lipid-binding protein n=1 Tax=Salegentibacter salarius TaxID=435906 RepID=A0A2N0TWB0_9FLAO|nr:YceI family protein [Salegentibacter salarius]OEY72687.1 lipid-binding protein [Salegentibacter salarius]PKD19020.1 lipid-binding protein [Salegentibacter salarius]SLK00968.1 Polyisoprenoid-binding protein YceI [Salegentibacter salarius]
MKKNLFKGALASTVIVSLLSFTNVNAQEKKVEVKDSNIEWKGEKVTGSHEGTIDLKDGYFTMENGELKGGEFVMDMTSITVTDLEGEDKGKLESHLKSDDFFGVNNHPTAKLVITSVAKKSNDTYGVVADLTIKEKTNSITFDLDMDKNSASTELTIDRSKYDVRYGSGSFFDNLGDKTIYDNFELDVELKF